MRPLALVLLALSLAAPALADPRPVVPAKGLATQCLSPTGHRLAAQCRTYETSLIATEPDICICGAAREVKAPYCAPGEIPAPDSAAADSARLAAADRGDLLTARFEGRRFCQSLDRSGP